MAGLVVTFDAGVKRIQSSLKRGDDGAPVVVISIQLEAGDIGEEDVKRLIHLQRAGELRFTVVARQGHLFTTPVTIQPAGDGG